MSNPRPTPRNNRGRKGITIGVIVALVAAIAAALYGAGQADGAPRGAAPTTLTRSA